MRRSSGTRATRSRRKTKAGGYSWCDRVRAAHATLPKNRLVKFLKTRCDRKLRAAAEAGPTVLAGRSKTALRNEYSRLTREGNKLRMAKHRAAQAWTERDEAELVKAEKALWASPHTFFTDRQARHSGGRRKSAKRSRR